VYVVAVAAKFATALQAVPLLLRWTVKPLTPVAVFVHVNVTLSVVPVLAVAACKPVGADGNVKFTLAVFDAAVPNAFTANT
jgi:hypothetical protein